MRANGIASAAKAAARFAGLDHERAQRTKKRVESSRMWAERLALALVKGQRPPREGRILCYHSVGQPVLGTNDVAPAQFRRQLELALAAGFRFRPAREIAQGLGTDKDLAVTFDDACISVFTTARPILRDHAIPYTVFAVADWSAHRDAFWRTEAMDWKQLAALQDEGVEIGSHSLTHPDFARLDAEQAAVELTRSRAEIERALGTAPDSFAIPFGQSANWTDALATLAREAGYAFVYAQSEDKRPPGSIGRTFVTSHDGDFLFRSLLAGKFDSWEEWVWA